MGGNRGGWSGSRGAGFQSEGSEMGWGRSAPKAPLPQPRPYLCPPPTQPTLLPEWAVRWGLRVAGGGPRWGVRGGGPLAHRTSTPGLSCPSSPVPPGPSSDGERNLGFGDREGRWGNPLDDPREKPPCTLPPPELPSGHGSDLFHDVPPPLQPSSLTHAPTAGNTLQQLKGSCWCSREFGGPATVRVHPAEYSESHPQVQGGHFQIPMCSPPRVFPDFRGPGIPDGSPRELQSQRLWTLASWPPASQLGAQSLTLGGSGGGVSSAGVGLQHKDGVSRFGVWGSGRTGVGQGWRSELRRVRGRLGLGWS